MSLRLLQQLGTGALIACGLTIARSTAEAQQSAAHEFAPSSMSDARGEVRTVEDTLAQQRGRPRRRKTAAFSNVGYVDNAIIGTQLQVRYDFAHGVNRPDRAEFIYGKCGCYREVFGVSGNFGIPAGVGDPNAPGPAAALNGRNPFETPFILTDLNYQDFIVDAEYAFHPRFSLFAEVPVRILDVVAPDLDTESGIGDITTGVKIGIIADSVRSLTFQVRAYLPTGDAMRGLGTDHLSLEPSVLLYNELTPRLKVEAEVRYWLPIDGSTGLGTEPIFDAETEYSGGVFRFGAGIGYDVSPESAVRFTPTVEVVGWTVLSGIATTSSDGTLDGWDAEDVGGVTVVNLKVGARIGFRERDSIFIGFGESLTDTVWYERTVRVEYRFGF